MCTLTTLRSEIHYGCVSVCVCLEGVLILTTSPTPPFIPLLLNWLAVINESIMCVQHWLGGMGRPYLLQLRGMLQYLSYSNFPPKPSLVLTGYILGV